MSGRRCLESGFDRTKRHTFPNSGACSVRLKSRAIPESFTDGASQRFRREPCCLAARGRRIAVHAPSHPVDIYRPSKRRRCGPRLFGATLRWWTTSTWSKRRGCCTSSMCRHAPRPPRLRPRSNSPTSWNASDRPTTAPEQRRQDGTEAPVSPTRPIRRCGTAAPGDGGPVPLLRPTARDIADSRRARRRDAVVPAVTR